MFTESTYISVNCLIYEISCIRIIYEATALPTELRWQLFN